MTTASIDGHTYCAHCVCIKWPLVLNGCSYNVGYATVRARLEDARLRHAWLARLGYCSLPIFFGGRLLKGWLRALRWWRRYGIRWYEVPAIFAIAICGCLLEIPGMVRALRGEPPPPTLFR